MKKLCSDCKARFDVKTEDLEEGDSVNCPECNLEYTIVSDTKGKLKLVETKQLEMEESEEDEDDEGSTDYESDD
jgi:uncharacterized protein YbaR (Trm112 family)